MVYLYVGNHGTIRDARKIYGMAGKVRHVCKRLENKIKMVGHLVMRY